MIRIVAWNGWNERKENSLDQICFIEEERKKEREEERVAMTPSRDGWRWKCSVLARSLTDILSFAYDSLKFE